MRQIRRKVILTPGPFVLGVSCQPETRRKKFADYVLYWEPVLKNINNEIP
jgi:hypothetical protein